MITLKKFLVTVMTAAMITTCFGTTVYASELTEGVEGQSLQEVTEDTGNTNNITEDPELDTTIDAVEPLTEEEQEFGLQEGYYIDEQGQVFYDETIVTIEEPVIEDVISDEEDAEEEAAGSTVVEETKEATEGASQKENKETKEDASASKKPSYTEEELRLLASLVYAEAGNQSYSGMLAVANVVLNRMKSDVYWHVNTVEEVIYDHRWSVQFAVTVKSSKTGLSMLDKALKSYDTGKFTGGNPEAEKKAMERAIKCAKHALMGKNNIGGYLCFQNKRSAKSIKKKYPNDYKILGDHIFYRTK